METLLRSKLKKDKSIETVLKGLVKSNKKFLIVLTLCAVCFVSSSCFYFYKKHLQNESLAALSFEKAKSNADIKAVEGLVYQFKRTSVPYAAFMYLAQHYQHQGDYKRATDLYMSAVQNTGILEKKNLAYYPAGLLFKQLKDNKASLFCFYQIILSNQKEYKLKALNEVAAIYEQSGQNDLATKIRQKIASEEKSH